MSLLSDLGRRYSKVAKPIVDSVPGLKWVGQSPTNFWTGFRLTKTASAIGISALALYSVGSGVKAAGDYKQQEVLSNAQNVGILPAMRYENTGRRSDLGASGDIVFGLHNMRRG